MGDVLVAHERGVVGAVHVAPVVRIGECRQIRDAVRSTLA